MSPSRRRAAAVPAMLLVAGLVAFATAGLTGPGGFAGGLAFGGLLGTMPAPVRDAAGEADGRPARAEAAPSDAQGHAADGSDFPSFPLFPPATDRPARGYGGADGHRDAARWIDPETGVLYGPDGEMLAEGYALDGQGGSLAALLQAIGAADSGARSSTAETFVAAAAVSGMEDVMAAALPGLYDRDPSVRYYALVALGASALASAENAALLADAVPYILGRLGDDDAAVREAAAGALATVQPAPPAWGAGPLAATLSDPDRRVVAAAQATLELVGPVDAHTAEIVSADLYSEDPLLRSRAARTLGAVAGDTEAGLSLLIWSLGDDDAGVRWQAATSLGEVGPAAVEAAWDLTLMAQDPDEVPAVRDAAELALTSILQ